MRPSVMGRYRAIAPLTAVVSGLVTIAFARLPQLHLGYAWPAVRLALETSGSLIALFATFLVFGRLRRRTYLNELLLACALAVLALISSGTGGARGRPPATRRTAQASSSTGSPTATWPGSTVEP